METIIRNAVAEDFDSIFPLFVQLWPDKPIDRDALRTVFERGAASGTDELLCAVADGAVIGFTAYAFVNNLWQEGYIAYLYAMVVEEKFRGGGVGTLLIEEILKRAKARGMKRVELDSGFPRERAHQFYMKLGFEKRAFLFSYVL